MSQETIIFFLAICAALLLAVVLYQRWADTRGIRGRLREIGGKLREIAETGSDEQIMVFTGDRELMELAAQINAVLEELRRVKADHLRVEASSRKMLSNISHDIKTPMTVILGYLEIMRLNGEASPETLEKAERKARDVVELVNQFFDLAKLESGDMDLEISRIDACEVCRESVLDFYEILTRDGFRVELGLPEGPVCAWGNREALSRIVGNLISNAVRYGGDGKYLGLALREAGDHVAVTVTDHGKGVEKAFADRIFDRLFTLEDSRSRKIQGNGLGLTIARQLARQLGGDLTVESEPGVRTVFTLTLRKVVY